MMLQYSEVQPIFIAPAEDRPTNAAALDVNSVLQHINNDIYDIPDSSSNISSNSSSSIFSKNIYVCTFCQVFSPIFRAISEHIASSHAESVPPEVSPENFVSRLQALHANAEKKKGKVGRPRKNQKICFESSVQKQPSEPVPGPDGLFWCRECLRNFKKPRQLAQHICFDLEDQLDIDLYDCSIPSKDEEFRTHVDVDPVPWSRMQRRTNCTSNQSYEAMECISNIENNAVSENRVLPNWREDPAYIPLFCDESEKSAFEKHLKSIDYSCVDALFKKEDKCYKSSKKQNCAYMQDAVYSCDICKKVLKSLSHIRLHCLTHTNLKPFTCTKCAYSTNSKGSLYLHMRKHTGNMFCCSFCDFKCIKRSHLLDHEATHSSVTQFCKLCKNSYKTLKSLINHIKKYHNNPGGKKYIKSLTEKQTPEFKCDICNKKFKSSNTLKKHSQVCNDDSVRKVISLEKNLTDKNLENLDTVMQNSECLHTVLQNSDNLDCITQNSKNLNNVIQNSECLDSIIQNSKNLDCIIQNSENLNDVMQNSECLDSIIQNSENLDNVMQNSACLESIIQNSENLGNVIQNSKCLDSIIQNSKNLDCIMQNPENLDSAIQITKSNSLEQLIENVQCNVVLFKDPLVEILLNDIQNSGNLNNVIQNSDCIDSIIQNPENLDCIMQNSENLDNVMQNSECLDSIIQSSENLDCIMQNPENLDTAIQINKSNSLEQLIENVQCNVVLFKDPLVEIFLNNIQNSENLDNVIQNSECLDSIMQNPENLDCIMQNPENLDSVLQINKSNSLEQLIENVQCNVVLSKDPLVEMMLNNFLQQGQSQSIMYENVLSSGGNMLENFPSRRMSNLSSSESSIIKECQKTLDFDILNECLQNTDFSNECSQEFGLQTSGCSLQSNSKSSAENGTYLQHISEDKSDESKPVEIKLFEKCRRDPAYVCCVCSAIYICSSTLKAHLKEHVNIINSTLMNQPEEQFETSRIIETMDNLENDCEMLEELEKLYTSSLGKMWYLPELKIVLQHDPALSHSVLDDDISNFSMTDKYDASQDLCAKHEDENMLRCFNEI